MQSIGLVYYTLSDNQKALDNYTQALHIRRALGDRYGEAITLTSIASVYSNLGEKQKAIQFYTSVALFQSQKKTAEATLTLTSSGGVYANVGNTQKALASYNQALEIQRATGDKSSIALLHKSGNRLAEAEPLNQISFVYDYMGKQERLDALNKAV